MNKDNFLLLHLSHDNSPVCIAKDTVHMVIKDYVAASEKAKYKTPDMRKTCVYFKEQQYINRVFVNESVERVYNMLTLNSDVSEDKNV